MTTSPPCLQVTAWWPRESRVISGQKGHMNSPVISNPSLNAARYSLDSRCNSKPTEGITDSQVAA